MGRQLKPVHCRRSERIEIRLTKEESQKIFMRSIMANMTTSDYIRKLVLGTEAYMEKASPDQAMLIDHLNDLNKIGHTLYQISRSGIYGASPEKSALLSNTLQEIKTLSAELIKKINA
jgi:hypothetical protein